MGRRRRRQRGSYTRYQRRHRAYQQRKRNGWGMNLYRNTRDGKIGGVCAGLADHWDVEHWVVRLLAVIALLFTGSLAFWLYLAAWCLLSPRRRDADFVRAEDEWEDDDEFVEMEYDQRQHGYRPKKMFRYSESPGVRLERARERLDAALRRVEDMETYVTSRQYNLNEEFSKL